MFFKDLPINGLFQLVTDGPWHTKTGPETYDDDRYCPQMTTVTPPDEVIVAGEISTSLLQLLKFYQEYHSVGPETQRRIRHVVYQRTGKFGKAFFNSIAPIMEEWFNARKSQSKDS